VSAKCVNNGEMHCNIHVFECVTGRSGIKMFEKLCGILYRPPINSDGRICKNGETLFRRDTHFVLSVL